MPAKYLREISIYADKSLVNEFKGGFVQRFHREACCISELFCSYLAEAKCLANGISKILIRMVVDRQDMPSIPKPDLLAQVVICRWPFDFHRYHSGDDVTKKLLLAEATRDCLVRVSEVWSWDKSIVLSLYREAEKSGFLFKGISKASWLDPQGKYRVRIGFDWGIDAIELTAILYKNRSSREVVRKYLGEAIPAESQLSRIVRSENGNWLDSTTFELQASDFIRKRWTISFAGEMQGS